MSLDIDIQNFAGEFSAPVAGEQNTDQNFYQQESGDQAYVHQDLLEPAEATPKAQEEPSPQELNFAALRQEVDRIKAEKEAEKREYQLQLDMLRANVAQQQAAQTQPKKREMFDGLDKDYVPNVDEIRREWSDREAAYQSRLEELEFQTMHPDYAEVMEKYSIPLVRQKPHLAEGLKGAANKALFAYELGKMAQQMQTNQAPPPPRVSESAQRIVENSKKPGHLSQVGGQSVLSKTDYYATMSDQEFYKLASRNLEGI
jgi:hypothetical protein